MDSFSKYPSETFIIDTDFTDVLGTGETITAGSSSVKAYQDNGDETDVSSTLIDGAVSVSGNKLRVRVKGGTEDINYFIKFVAVTSANNTFQNVVRVRVLRQFG